MPNNHAMFDVAQITTASPISNILAIIYHIIKEGSRRVMILLDIRSPLRRREPIPGRWKCFVSCETATIIKQSDEEEDIIMPTI